MLLLILSQNSEIKVLNHFIEYFTITSSSQGIDFCVNSLSSALARLSVIASSVQSGEFDFDGSRDEKPVPPGTLLNTEL